MKKIMLCLAVFTAGIVTTHQVQSQSWGLNGNAGTNASTNFLGTTDNVAFKIRTNNQVRMTINGAGKVGVGNGNPKSRLDVFGATAAADTVPVGSFLVKKTGNFDIVGLRSTSAPAPSYGIGMEGNGNFIGAIGNGGIFGLAGVSGAIGVSGEALGTSAVDLTGVQGLTSGGNSNIGVYGNGSGGATADYGIFGEQPDTASNDYALVGIGDVFAWRYFIASDRKLKNNIQPVANALDRIKNIHASTYTFDHSKYAGKSLPFGTHIGFMADEVEQQFPELIKQGLLPAGVKRGDRGNNSVQTVEDVKVVNYLGMIPVLTQAINEQREIVEQKDAEINMLKSQLAQINARLSAIENQQGSPVRKSVIVSGNSLTQNEPNPFNHSTVIRYSVTDNTNGVIIIYDANGKEVSRHSTDSSGLVEIKAGKLAAGMYTYSLTVNGQVVDSRQMMITK